MNVSGKQTLSIALETLEAPNDARVVFGLVSCLTGALRVNSNVSCSRRHWDHTYNTRRKIWWFEDCLDPDWNLNFAKFRVLLDYRDHLEWQINVLRNAVGHHVERTIWRNKSDASISVKLSKSHALVELDVIYLDSFVYFVIVLLLHQESVIDTKLALWHPR